MFVILRYDAYIFCCNEHGWRLCYACCRPLGACFNTRPTTTGRAQTQHTHTNKQTQTQDVYPQGDARLCEQANTSTHVQLRAHPRTLATHTLGPLPTT